MSNRSPRGIAFHPRRGTLFILGDRRLVELSRTGSLLHTHSVDATLAQAALAFDAATGDLIAVSPQPRRIVRLSADDGRVLSRRAMAGLIPPALTPRGLAVRPRSGNWVFATDSPSIIVEAAPITEPMTGILLR